MCTARIVCNLSNPLSSLPAMQDVLEILESWLALMQHCPRHFRLSLGVLEGMAAFALPAAGERCRRLPSCLPGRLG